MVNDRLHNNQSGFTLIELLVVIGILTVLMAVTLIAINPSKHFQDARNSQRQANVTTILNAIYEYESANRGSVPASMSAVTTSPQAISKTVIDLCALAPTYVADLPLDPSSGTVTGGSTPCAAGVSAYDTGYTINANSSGNRYTISAPSAEGGASISVTE